MDISSTLKPALISPPPCFIIVKEGMDMGQVSGGQIADDPCHVAHGVHHKAVVGDFFFH